MRTCSVALQNVAGWEAGNRALPPSLTDTGISLRVRVAFTLYTVGTMAGICLLCRNCGDLILRIRPWVRCMDCNAGLMEVDLPTRSKHDLVADWVAV